MGDESVGFVMLANAGEVRRPGTNHIEESSIAPKRSINALIAETILKLCETKGIAVFSLCSFYFWEREFVSLRT